jgi:uncharacterized protein (TIGR02265 family)
MTTAATSGPEAKGSGFNSVTTVLRDMLGAAGFAAMTQKLQPATETLIKTPPLPVQWIPCDCYGDLITTALAHSFGGDQEQIVEMGRRAFRHDLSTMYRMFIKLLTPRHVIERAARLWLTYNRNNGQLRAVQTGDHRCEVVYEGVSAVYPGFWAYQRGCIMAAVQATGYKTATVNLTRGGGRDGNGTFVVDWNR